MRAKHRAILESDNKFSADFSDEDFKARVLATADNENINERFSTAKFITLARSKLAAFVNRFRSTAGSFQFAYLPVRTDDGLVQGRLVYRSRLPNGAFHYRLATPDEQEDYVSREAW